MKIDMQEILDFIRGYVTQHGKIPQATSVTDDFDFSKTGAIDSIGIFKLLITLERRYDIEISSVELKSPEFSKINGLAAIIQKHLDEKKGAR
jgi:acyl carrier protein